MIKHQTKGKCSKCNEEYMFSKIGYTDRELEDGIIEVGIECPNCKYWVHVFFTNKDLIDLAPSKDSNRDKRRLFKIKFDRFNKKIRRKFKMVKSGRVWIRKVNHPNIGGDNKPKNTDELKWEEIDE